MTQIENRSAETWQKAIYETYAKQTGVYRDIVTIAAEMLSDLQHNLIVSAPSPALPTRSDTREQAAASPSAAGEGLLIELLRRAYRFVQSDNEFTERDWTEYENTKDEIRAVLSGQSPLRDALQTMIASAEVYVERDEVIGYRIKTGALHRVIGMLGLTVPCNLPVATLHANYGGFTQKSLDDARDYPISSQAPKPASAGGVK